MVTKWGMSDKLGPLQYEDQSEGYLGMGGSQRLMMSDETNMLIDSEIRLLVDNAHARAHELLNAKADQLHLLANAMLEYETLTGEEIRQLLETGQIDRPDLPLGPLPGTQVRGSAIPKAGGKRLPSGPATQGA
jgi:cell division protease FtsH